MLLRILPTKWLIKRYIHHGACFGDAVSYLYMGECVGFRRMLRRLIRYEAEIARRGYMPHALCEFEGYGGYGKPLPKLRELEPGEDPVLDVLEFQKENPSEIPAVFAWWRWFERKKKTKGDKNGS